MDADQLVDELFKNTNIANDSAEAEGKKAQKYEFEPIYPFSNKRSSSNIEHLSSIYNETNFLF